MEKSYKHGLAAAVAAGLSLWAAEAAAGGFVGVSVGQSDLESDIDLGGGSENVSGDDTAWKIFGGYMFNDFIGAEVGYLDLGEPSDSFGFDGGETAQIDAEITGWTLALLGQIPVGPVDLFAKLGIISYDADVDVKVDGSPFGSAGDEGEDLMYGIGAKLNLGPVGVRVEYELFDIDDVDDLYLLSIGAQINF